MIRKIVSGGQTGVDQAALDAAIGCDMSYGGWLPAGRRTENGPLPARYYMQVLEAGGYPERTRKNVLDSDATLIISHGPLTGGSALTAKIAYNSGRPFIHVNLLQLNPEESLVIVKDWLKKNQPGTLNVAGPRASTDKTIYNAALSFITKLLKNCS